MATLNNIPFENGELTKTYNAVDSVDQLLFVQVCNGLFGGYRQDLLISPLNDMQIEFLVCHECQGVMRKASQIGEDQISVCEVCVTEGVSHSMMKSRKMIPTLEVQCPLTNRGCRWNGIITEVEEHLNMCQQFAVNCTNSCGVILQRADLNEHLIYMCVKRVVDCDDCHLFFLYRDLSQHYDVCLEVELLCTNECGVVVMRGQLNTHMDTDCINSLIECPYSKYGCEHKMRKCELEEHKRENELIHLQCTASFAVNMMEEVEKKVIKVTKVLEQLSYPTVLRDFIPKDSLKRIKFLRPSHVPCFCIHWRFFDLHLDFLALRSDKDVISVTISVGYDTTRSPLAKWPFEGKFKLTFIDVTDIHKCLIFESAVIKLLPGHESFDTAEEAYPYKHVLAEIPRKPFLKDILTENKLQFTLQIQETQNILLMESIY